MTKPNSYISIRQKRLIEFNDSTVDDSTWQLFGDLVKS